MTHHTKSFHIAFQPLGLRARFPEGQSILECARNAGVDLVSVCGGNGTCGKCKVQIVSGDVSEPTQRETDVLTESGINKGYRMACQTFAKSDLVINIPAESLSALQRLQVEGLEIPLSPDPLVQSYHLELSAPSLSDLRGDDIRVMDGLGKQHGIPCHTMDEAVLRSISSTLRTNDWRVSAFVREQEVISLGAVDGPSLGVAIDLGTTKVAGYLVDLQTGKTLAAKGVMNPQIAYGEDVIARIVHARKSPEDASMLQAKVVESLNRLSHDLCREVTCKQENIQEMVIVGNTAMHHLLLNLPVGQLAKAPYVPAVSGAMDVKARDLGFLTSKGAYVHVLPNIAAFVGADHVAMLEGCHAWDAKGPLLAIDIGTNTEISLAVDGHITSVSCASGPAFEGAHISHGMRASSGAIDHFQIIDGSVTYHTIQGTKPTGICGSGIFDILAQLFLNNIVDQSGRIIQDHPRVQDKQNIREFIIVDKHETANGSNISITQGDVRELQLAKAAIQTGINVLLKDRGLAHEDVSEVVVAGAFGNYLDLSSVIAIGMFPNLTLSRFRQVGNAAGMGAKIALISGERRQTIQKLTRKIRYIELADFPGFNDIYMKAISLGHNQMGYSDKIQ
ncbi:MAG: DUF4445 domain-containing protein [Deltaproteobacteria bacterium]|nr:DUF4445 domain-containing protein [Deltaproteobacteria bacterium]